MRNLVMILVLCLALAGCGAKNEVLPAVPEQSGSVSAEEQMEFAESSCQAEAPEQDDYPMMVMVDGVLYTYEKPCEELGRCGMMDGTITSSVDGVPAEDNQSNFGEGYEYQFLGDAIDVYFPEEELWQHFVSERVRFLAEIEAADTDETERNWFVVRSVDGKWWTGQRFMISQDYWTEEEALQVGQMVLVECADVVTVECADMDLETVPAQLDVYSVEAVYEDAANS